MASAKFVTPNVSFETHGIFRSIRCPAEDGHDVNGTLQREIRKGFEDAERAGIENPVIVGAIPFDTRKPSSLFIPESTNDVDFAEAETKSDSSSILQLRSSPDHESYLRMISDAISAIKAGHLDKVVLSRRAQIDVEGFVDTDQVFKTLLQQNSKGYKFQVDIEGGTLIGASPELILEKKESSYHTMPLAGTMKRKLADPVADDNIAAELFNSDKNRHEHAVVIEAVEQKLAPHSTNLHVPKVPLCISTPKVWHLATPIDGVAKAGESALSLGLLLHPTPALSGFPNAEAVDLIQKLEPFDRGYYGGIVGYSDARGNGEWFIAIRCGLVDPEKKRVYLYGGGGIVSNSDPETEWQETCIKLATMLQAFGIDENN